jgi:hypothetical protein
MKRNIFRWAVGFLVLLSLPLLGIITDSVFASVGWPTDEVREIHYSVKEFVEEYSPAKWSRQAGY